MFLNSNDVPGRGGVKMLLEKLGRECMVLCRLSDHQIRPGRACDDTPSSTQRLDTALAVGVKAGEDIHIHLDQVFDSRDVSGFYRVRKLIKPIL